MSAVVTPAPLTPAPQAEWFLARDGQQFGPLSDPELRKLVDLGHLKPSDLLWREGFPEWRSAKILLPEAGGAPKPLAAVEAAPAPAPIVPAPTAPVEAPSSAIATPAHRSPVSPAVVPQAAPVSTPAAVLAPQPAPAQAHPSAFQPSPQAPTVQAPVVQAASVQSPLVQARVAPAPAPQSLAQRAAAAAQAAITAPSAPVAAAPATQPAGVRAPQPAPSAPQMRAPTTVPLHAAPGPQARPQSQVQSPHPAQAPAPQRPHTFQPVAMAQPMPQAAPPGYPAPSAPIAHPRTDEPGRSAPRLGPEAAPKRGRTAPVASDDFDDELDAPRAGIGRWIARVAVIVFFLATLSAAGLYAYPHRDSIVSFAKGLMPASVATPSAKSPLIGFAPAIEATDAALQAAPLWQTLKREFPEWYTERVREASALVRDKKAESEIADQMMAQVMALRRKHAGDALSATSAKLKGIATAFAENLVRLRKGDVAACHGFITAGETNAAYLKMLGDPAHTAALQTQLTSVFEAVAEGRKVPRVYPQPKQVDYNTVVSLLEKRGWTNADMRLFSDSGSFAKTEPDKMCKMVIDWFQAQLEITDSESQMRLLSDALKPVIAG